MKYNAHTKGTKKPNDTGPVSKDPTLPDCDYLRSIFLQ